MAEEHTTPLASDRVVSVYLTFPDEGTAVTILGRLLEERLIACANILPAARSLYRWQDAVQDESEVVAFAKTTANRLEDVVSRVGDLHPFETPCAVAMEIPAGSPGYLSWVREETSV